MRYLRRIHVEGLGIPTECLFDPLTIDLSNPRSLHACIDSLMWMPNGGGKTSFLSLTLSTVLPSSDDFLGTVAREKGKPPRELRHYLGRDGTGHVILEWLGGDGSLLITAVCMEWSPKDRERPSQERTRPNRDFYIFTPTVTLTFDDLIAATRSGGRRLRAAEFRNLLDSSARRDPRLRLKRTERQRDWHDLLIHDGGIDPDAFRYQLKMNAREGGADKFLEFSTADEFVNFLLEVAMRPEDVKQVEELLSKHKEKLEERPRWETERSFNDGAAGFLRELVPARDLLREEQDAAIQAEAALRWLYDGLVAAAAHARRSVDVAARDESSAAARRDELGAQRSSAQRRERSWKVRAAELRDEAAGAAVEEREAAERRLLAERDAWSVAERTAEQMQVRVESAVLRDALDGISAPLEQAVREVAGRLAGTLSRQAEAARAAAATASADADTKAGVAASEEQARQQCAEELTTARITRDQQQRIVAEAGVASRQARERGDLEAREKPSRALARSGEKVVELHEHAAGLSATIDTLNAEIARIAPLKKAADTELRTAHELEATAQAGVDEMARRVHRLQDDDDLAAIAESPIVDIFERASQLRALLGERTRLHEARLLDEALAGADDERALVALRQHGFLPAAVDTEHALAVLEAAGIPATSGWRALADMVDPEQWEAALAASPALVAGVVISKAEDVERARASLLEAELAPTSVMAIDTAHALLRPEVRASFILPPAAALYNAGAVAVECTRREARSQARRQSTDRLTEILRDARRLLAALDDLVRDYPADVRQRLSHELCQATEMARTASRELGAAESDLQSAERARELAREAKAGADAEASATEMARARIDALVSLVERAAVAEDEVERLEQQIPALAAAVDEHKGLAERARAVERDLRNTAAEQTGHTQQLDTEAARVLPHAGGDFPPSDGSPVAELRAAFEVALAQRQRVGSESETAIRLKACTERLQRIGEELAGKDGAVAAATLLLCGHDGATAQSRQAALARAERAFALAQQDASDARSHRKETSREFEGLIQSETAGIDTSVCHDPEDADRRAAIEAVRVSNLRNRVTAAENEVERAKERAVRAKTILDNAVALTAALSIDLSVDANDEPSPQPDGWSEEFATPERSGAEVRKRKDVLKQARVRELAKQARVEKVLESIRIFAGQARFEVLRTQNRDRMMEARVGPFVDEAERLRDDVELRSRQAAKELDAIAEIRKDVTAKLLEAVDEAFRILRQIERVSELPKDGFDGWNGQHFLKLDYKVPELAADRLAVLETVVDDIMQTKDSMSGAKMVLRSVAKLNTKGKFKVEVLKPNTLMEVIRIPIEELARASGGQKLTAATLLYCMFTQLRSRHRGGSRREIAGTLILDNPIGTANHIQLLDLQCKVAELMKVQLFVTTGVKDFDAVDAFPKKIRLRQQRAQRTGNLHVTVASIEVDEEAIVYVQGAAITRHVEAPPPRSAA